MTPDGGRRTHQEFAIANATCLGCGCACDDIRVRVQGSEIVEAGNACPLGVAWFGDGAVPAAVRVSDRDTTVEEAVDAVHAMLSSAQAPLIYLAPELSCETQRLAIALADLLHGSLDTITSATALQSILGAQERGRAGATLGEVRNRADVLVFWGVDPALRYPRYSSRYAPEPAGLFVSEGRRARQVIAVDIGGTRGPADADARVGVGEREEVAVLTAIAAVVRKPDTSFEATLGARVEWLARQLTAARYAVIVADAEPASGKEDGAAVQDPQRAAALIALTQALNGPTRAALSTLRGGGNRSGADAVLTAGTGYPTGVSFTSGRPLYRPYNAAAGADVVLLVGDAAQVPAEVMSILTSVPLTIVGPRASRHAAARVAIDTGTAGIHLGGTAMRMDDVPLPLRPSIVGPRDPVDVLGALISRLTASARAARRANPPTPAGEPASLSGLRPHDGTTGFR